MFSCLPFATTSGGLTLTLTPGGRALLGHDRPAQASQPGGGQVRGAWQPPGREHLSQPPYGWVPSNLLPLGEDVRTSDCHMSLLVASTETIASGGFHADETVLPSVPTLLPLDKWLQGGSSP